MWRLLAACGAPRDPAWDGAPEALAAAERGERALAAGDAAGAREAFREARRRRGEPVLAAWEGRAALADGDVVGAEALLREALAAEPALAGARWDLALALARQDRHADATVELQRALAEGAGTALDVRADPDWAAFLADPAYAFVPASALRLEAEPLPATTFWGSDLAVRVVAEGRFGDAVYLRAPVEGPVRLRSLAEEGTGQVRRFTATFRVVGAGPVRVGPFSLEAAGGSAEADALTTTASAPPGKVPPATPSAPLASLDLLPREPSVVDGVLYVPAPGGEPAALVPAAEPVRYERRGADDARTVIWAFPAPPPGATLTVGGRPVPLPP